MTSTTRLVKKITRRIRYKYNNPQGCAGKYVQISATKGIKIMHSRFSDTQCEGFKQVLRNALDEVYYQREARKRIGIVPKCYGVKVLKIHNEYVIGIVMQHIGNMRLSKLRHSDKMPYEQWPEQKIKRILESAGIQHNDIHGSNIMYFKGKYWVIDFDPDYLILQERNYETAQMD